MTTALPPTAAAAPAADFAPRPVRQAQRKLGPHMYARKMSYAAAALDVASSFGDARVAACDVWRAVVQHGLASAGRSPLPAGEFCVVRPWEAMVRWRLPGSGPPLAEDGLPEERV